MKHYLLQVIPTLLFVWVGIHGNAQDQVHNAQLIDSMPSIPFLPDPLILDEGGKNIPVTTSAQWNEQRHHIADAYQQWISGTVPPSPKTVKANVLSESVENGVTVRLVEISFGPEEKAKMTVELMIPEAEGQLPVFMTQWNHRGWAQIAVRRGYIGCVYAGADAKDDTENYGTIYGDYDFATLMKRAWGASRVVDYLYTLAEVDTAKIGITGHSRNGKQSLMAAAFDTRIKAVVSSSGGTGGESTFRFSDERFDSESLKEITDKFPHWFSTRLPLFAGKEQKLPVDQNSLISLIAPRGVMLATAITEGQGNPWGIEQTYQSVRSVYQFLNADSAVRFFLRHGRHQQSARDIEDFIDFFDYMFGRSRWKPDNAVYAGYSFDEWKQVSGALPDVPEGEGVTAKINWLLGEEPAGVRATGMYQPGLNSNRSYPDDYLDEVIEGTPLPNTIAQMNFGPYKGLGDNLWGTLYCDQKFVKDKEIVGKLPLVIFLHGYTYSTGFHRRSTKLIAKLVEQGVAVLAYDMVGFGTRVEERRHFYDRYPNWSLMGKMVADTRNIIKDACTRMPVVDTNRVYLVGHSLGGTVALFTAALEPDVKGVAVISGVPSFREEVAGTEGLRHYSHLHGLLPRLGYFVGHESSVPLGVDEVLAEIAPRPVLVVAPKSDRNYPVESVKKMVNNAGALSGSGGGFQLKMPNGYQYMPDAYADKVVSWLLDQR